MKKIIINKKDSYYYCSSLTTHSDALLDAEARGVFCRMLGRVAGFCGVNVVSFCVTANRFDLLIQVPEQEKRLLIDDKELLRRFRLLYGDGGSRYMPIRAEVLEAVLEGGGEWADQWRERLRSRMHDLPMFMKMLKQRFSKWYNAKWETHGTLWAECYTSTLLEPSASVLRRVACAIDLMPLTLGLVARPEDYEWSAFGRAVRGDQAFSASLGWLAEGGGKARGASLRRYELLLCTMGGLIPVDTLDDAMRELFLEMGLLKGLAADPCFHVLRRHDVWLCMSLGSALVYGGYAFVSANARWVRKLLKRKKQGDQCHPFGDGAWTLNQRLKGLSAMTKS